MGHLASGLSLSASGHGVLVEGLAGFPGDAGQHARDFGRALASGDFDGDGHADLAVGAPFQDGDGGADVGAEMVVYGALFADGFETDNARRWSGTSP